MYKNYKMDILKWLLVMTRILDTIHIDIELKLNFFALIIWNISNWIVVEQNYDPVKSWYLCSRNYIEDRGETQ